MYRGAPLFAVLMVVVVVAMVEAQTRGEMTSPKAAYFKKMGVTCQQDNEIAEKGTCRLMCGKVEGDKVTKPKYTAGQMINVSISYSVIFQSSIYYYYFGFKLCPIDDSKVLTQRCLDSNVLKVVDKDGQLTDKYSIKGDTQSGSKVVRVQLPEGVTCSKCVLQWTFGFDKEKCLSRAPRPWACPHKGTKENCAVIAIKSD